MRSELSIVPCNIFFASEKDDIDDNYLRKALRKCKLDFVIHIYTLDEKLDLDSYTNQWITTNLDKQFKIRIEKEQQPEFRFGTGFDCHRLVEERKLILGGIEIPHVKGLLGHSDADVLTHAIMDALLSSLSLRDIGYHFSDKDAKYKDISSMILLEEVMKMINQKGYCVNNISAVIMAQKPKLSPYIPQILTSLATYLKINEKDIGITCTTTEKIGTVGREECIAVQAFCSVKPIK